jgi:hypothetical protein
MNNPTRLPALVGKRPSLPLALLACAVALTASGALAAAQGGAPSCPLPATHACVVTPDPSSLINSVPQTCADFPPVVHACVAAPNPDPSAVVACAEGAVAAAPATAPGTSPSGVNATRPLAALACCPCPPPCETSIVSDPGTVWTHYSEQTGDDAVGFRKPSVQVLNPYPGWVPIPGASWMTNPPIPQFIWKQAATAPTSDNPSNQYATRIPVMFEQDFASCIYHQNGVGESGATLTISADDSFLVVFNGQVQTPTPACNAQFFQLTDWTCWGNLHTIVLPPLVNAGNGQPMNHLVIYGWNTDQVGERNPAMIQYRLDY